MNVRPFTIDIPERDFAALRALGSRNGRDYLVRPARAWAERFFDVASWTEMPRGGHFAAMEAPELLAADIRHFYQATAGRP